MTRALVTGATGMLGRSMARRLLAAGLAVRAMVRPGNAATGLVKDGVEVVPVDVADQAAIERAVQGCHTVFHALGRVQVSAVFSRNADPQEVLKRTNVDITGRVLEASLKAGVVRFVHVSSTSVYSLDAHVPISEQALLAPPSDYGHSKWLAEAIVREHQARGLPTTIIRPCVIYGPGDRHFLPTLLPIARLPVLPLAGGGRYLHDFVYVDDVSELMWQASQSAAAVGQAYNSASGAPRPLREYLECLRRALGRGPRVWTIPKGVAAQFLGVARSYIGTASPDTAAVLTQLALSYFSRDVYYDVSKARADFGYVPRIGFERGLSASLSSQPLA